MQQGVSADIREPEGFLRGSSMIAEIKASRIECAAAISVHLNTFGAIICAGIIASEGYPEIAGCELDSESKEDPMKTGRRFFLFGFAAAFAGVKSLFAIPQKPTPAPFPRNSDPRRPGNEPDDIPTLPAPDPKAQLMENQKNLRRDADRLLQLVKDLKDEAEKTEQTNVLSLSLVKKAEEVEKLARHIKELARAS